MEKLAKFLLTGLFSVLMALVTSYGLCSVLGFFITPLHNFIPFLLLGLGVDDMFVLVQGSIDRFSRSIKYVTHNTQYCVQKLYTLLYHIDVICTLRINTNLTFSTNKGRV